MAILKNKDVSRMSKEELEKNLAELRLELVKKTSKPGEIKKTIARILTALKISASENK